VSKDVSSKINHVLESSEELKKKVGDRIYPIVAAVDSKMPAVVFQVTSYTPEKTMTGTSDYARAVVQITALSKSFKEAQEIAVIVREAMLQSISARQENIRMSFEYEGDFHEAAVDISFWNNEAEA
jgi:ABC-type uncharacterized transport system substrate-binding protein